jgi:hypothetical protein
MSARYEYNVASAEVAPCRLDTTAPDTTPTFYVVDESWSVRNSLRRLLRSYGFRVFTFASGSEWPAAEHGERIHRPSAVTTGCERTRRA